MSDARLHSNDRLERVEAKQDQLISLIQGDKANPGLRTEMHVVKSALLRLRLWIAGIVATLAYTLYQLVARSSHQ